MGYRPSSVGWLGLIRSSWPAEAESAMAGSKMPELVFLVWEFLHIGGPILGSPHQ